MTPATPRPVTTHDVARQAGVSQATVSMVMGNNPRARVAAATRERVLRVADELGYRPNLLARGLVRGRSFAVGIVVPDLSNPFYLDVVTGAQRVGAETGYAVLATDTRDAPASRQVELLRSRQVDGVILDGLGASSLPADALSGAAVVLVDEPPDRWPGVASDALAAGRMAAEHLLALGHREIAFVGPATDVHGFRMRERGFYQLLRSAGIELGSARLRRAPATLAGGQSAMRALLAQPTRPSAVFCANDMLGVGALKACLSAGLHVPGDISLLGCDDVELARVVTPELSTISIPARELGARAMRLLLKRLDDPTAEPPATRLLPVRLVARGTTGAPAGTH